MKLGSLQAKVAAGETMSSGIGLFAGVGLAGLLSASVAAAGPADDEARDARIAKLEAAVASLEAAPQNEQPQQRNAELKGEVGDLQAQVADLKSSTVEQLQDVRQTAAAAPLISFPNGRPTFATANGNFTASLRGALQFDAAAYSRPPGRPPPTCAATARRWETSNIDAAHARNLKDGDHWRRARIGIDGTALEIATTGCCSTSLAPGSRTPASSTRAGRSTGAEAGISASAPSRPRWAGRPGSTNGAVPGAAGRLGRRAQPRRRRHAHRRRGVRQRRSLAHLRAVTGRAIGEINTGTARRPPTPQTFEDQLGVVGRGAIAPLHGRTGWCWSARTAATSTTRRTSGPATTGVTPNTSYGIRLRDTPELRVDGTKFIDTGAINARNASEVGLEFAAQKNLFLQSEVESSTSAAPTGDRPELFGWYVEGTWVVTGEARKYNAGTAAFDAPAVAHPFNPGDGGWGAWSWRCATPT